ncbi:hypothetical protein ACPW7J_14050 [Ihubacter sp. rT4E-8]|uniref:hypothetical protein n=1 Tax=unclassified Ihubacter TaxID=2633299 RepID=UPI0013794601
MRHKNSKNVYTVDQLAEAAEVFESSPAMVRAALLTAGQATYTEEEARKVIAAFKQKEVK